jgi:general secretion pathway protein B
MSFILDALRKSEHERQRQTAPGIADLRPAVAARSGLPAWAIALGVLLLANIVIVALLVLRNVESREDGRAATRPEVPPRASVAPAPAAQPVPTQNAPAKPASGVSASVFRAEGLNVPAAPQEPVANEPEPAAPAGAVDREPEILEPLPTVDEMVARGTVLPPLHLDIHVFVAKPSGRFVFINQRKYREGAQLPEGPLVERITREGVVLTYGGSRFLMPRP